MGDYHQPSRAIKNEGHFPFNVSPVQVPCSAAQKIHGLSRDPGQWCSSKCSPWSNSHPVSWEWQIPDPTPELVHQNLWVGGHLEICPEDSLGEQSHSCGRAPRAESSWQVPQLVQLQVECFGRKRGLGAGLPPSWYREERTGSQESCVLPALWESYRHFSV